MGAEKNYGHGSAAHDEAKSFHAVHAGHFEIESDDVRMQLFDFFQGECAVHGRADDFDGRVACQDSRNELPHQGGIIDNENSDAVRSCDGSQRNGTREARKYGRHIEDEHDGAVAENGCATHEIAGDDVARQSLDDEFFFADHAVDDAGRNVFRRRR